jgi:S-DNA-T family DNA segregation ATPase FtsK/SpoIIIE
MFDLLWMPDRVGPGTAVEKPPARWLRDCTGRGCGRRGGTHRLGTDDDERSAAMPDTAPAGADASGSVAARQRVHRPQRWLPAVPPDEVVTLATPPTAAPPPATGLAALVVPALGAASTLAWAVVTHSVVLAVVAGLAGVVAVGAGAGNRLAARRSTRRATERARRAYLEHVSAAESRVAEGAAAQRAAHHRMNPAADWLARRCTSSGPPLWERRPADADFGTIHLGRGTLPAGQRLALPAGAGPFVDVDAEAALAGRAAVDRTARMHGAPVVLPLRDLGSVAVVGNPALAREVARAWLVQLAVLHSPDELRLAVHDGAAGNVTAGEWSWLDRLPHTTGPPAGAADLPDRMSVLVVDGYLPELGHEPDAQAQVVVTLCATAQDLPVRCAARVDLEADGTVSVHWADGRPPVTGVVPDRASGEVTELVSRGLEGRWPLGSCRPRSPEIRLPDLLAEHPPGSSLAVPVGRTPNGDLVALDLSEAADGGDGPHGVLVGATGSGKSELLRSLVLGLAVRRPAGRLAVVLVDFKGGAAFAELSELPHVAGLVTNLADDPAEVDRVRDALEGELDARQRLLRAHTAGSLRDLRTRWPEVAPPVLLVAVDEFGELLEARPDLVPTLARVGRLGRSLGVHLLLAAQRLDEGRLRGLESHLRYRLVMRTFSAAESVAALGSSAAYELPPMPGAGWLSVDGRTTRFTAPLTAAADHPGGPTDLERLVERARAAGGPSTPPVWLPPLPPRLTLAGAGAVAPGVAGVLGLVDEPRLRRRVPLVVDLLGGTGHVAVAGAGIGTHRLPDRAGGRARRARRPLTAAGVRAGHGRWSRRAQ